MLLPSRDLPVEQCPRHPEGAMRRSGIHPFDARQGGVDDSGALSIPNTPSALA